MKLLDKNLVRELLLSGDIFNTVNGGRVQAATQMDRLDDHYELTVRVPGIPSDQLKVEIKDNQLMVLHIREHENSAARVMVPFLIDSMEIPFDVEITGIHATMQDDQLTVIMPFNELANGYHRNIDIYNH